MAARAGCRAVVHLRMGGGILQMLRPQHFHYGSSPHGRGNRYLCSVEMVRLRFISAWAGVTGRSQGPSGGAGLSPRVGGTVFLGSAELGCMGLSPRVGGISTYVQVATGDQGLSPRVRVNHGLCGEVHRVKRPISAGAGNRCSGLEDPPRLRSISAGRGNPGAGTRVVAGHRSIAARAGKPRPRAGRSRASRVNLRSCGWAVHGRSVSCLVRRLISAGGGHAVRGPRRDAGAGYLRGCRGNPCAREYYCHWQCIRLLRCCLGPVCQLTLRLSRA